MNKRIRIATIAALVLLLISAGSVSAIFSGQYPETRANRIVEIAEDASQKVGDLIDLVYANATALTMIETAGLIEDFDGNVTLYDGGNETVKKANVALENDDYEGAIANATEALSIFREVYRSIHIILCNSDVKIGQLVDVDELEEAIDRSLERVEELEALISTEAPIYSNLTKAEDLLNEAKNEFLPDSIEEAKDNLREANRLISEVCQYLKEVAQDLNPQRIRDYCDEAEQYRYRFMGRFGQAGSEGFDVNGFLQTYGYQNEDDFMARFQEMIENAKGTEDLSDVLEDLDEIGRTIREMDGNLTYEVGQYRARHGQQAAGTGSGQEGSGSASGSGSGYGQNAGGYGGSGSGSGLMGTGGGQ